MCLIIISIYVESVIFMRTSVDSILLYPLKKHAFDPYLYADQDEDCASCYQRFAAK